MQAVNEGPTSRFAGNMHQKSFMKKQIAFLSLFLAFLIFFVWNSSWHLPSQLVITGQAESAADVRVSWDSGSGFNDMESTDAVFGNPAERGSKSGFIRMRRVGNSNPAAKTAEVWIKGLQRSDADDPSHLDHFASQEGMELTPHGYLRLKKNDRMLTVPAGKDFTAICFIANEYSGFVEIDLDGDRRLYDLYAEQPQDRWIVRKRGIYAPGEFTVKVNLPRYDIRRLRISSLEPLQTFRLTSVTIVSEKGDISLPLNGSGFRSTITFDGFPRNTRQYFHPIHFLQQILFAFLSAWLVLSIFRFVRRRGGITPILLEGKRPAFWLMFAGGLIAYSGWLLVYWPGHLTTDSIHIWWSAKNPGYFLHEHPFMNILYYRFMQQIWDHFAVVGLFQISATSLLGSYIFYDLYKNGLPFILIIPFYLWFITSVPIGLYNITLWKDIPFAILVVFWAYYFTRLRLHSYNKVPEMNFIVLIMLLLSVSLFRYNGLIYLILIPLGLAIYQGIATKKIAIASLTVLLIVSASILFTSIAAKHDFVFGITKKFAVRLLDTNIFMNIKNIAIQYPNIFDDRNKYTWYRDNEVVRWHYEFAKNKGYNDFVKFYDHSVKSEILSKYFYRFMQSSHERPYVWLSWNPFYLLYLFLLAFFYKWFPLVAAYGYILLTQTFFLLMFLLEIHGAPNFDWRYNYYLFFAGFFLIPLVMLDIKRNLQRRPLKT